jgi:hypothetical protein
MYAHLCKFFLAPQNILVSRKQHLRRILWVTERLLLVLASAVILRSESHGTHDHILLSSIRDCPNLEGQVLVFISPRIRVARLCPHALGSLFIASFYSQGYFGGIRPFLQRFKDIVKVTLRLTVSQSVSLGVELHLGLRTRYLLLFDRYGLVFWGALSDERTGREVFKPASTRVELLQQLSQKSKSHCDWRSVNQ